MYLKNKKRIKRQSIKIIEVGVGCVKEGIVKSQIDKINFRRKTFLNKIKL